MSNPDEARSLPPTLGVRKVILSNEECVGIAGSIHSLMGRAGGTEGSGGGLVYHTPLEGQKGYGEVPPSVIH